MARTKKRADGRYARQVYIGLSEEGKRQYKTFYAATQKEADRLAAEFKSALGRGLDPHAGKKTVKDLLDNLLAVKKAQGVGASWQRSLAQYAKHFAPLYDIPAEKVRTSDIQQIMSELSDKGLAHKTIREIGTTIRTAFTLAIPEIVQYNPCDRLVIPTGRPSKKREWLDEERQAWIRDTPHRAQRAAMLMMYSGLRRGEATALTWADIDLTAHTITVNKSWDFVANRCKQPKTAAGVRTVHIPQLLADFLSAERAADPDTIYVIHTVNGSRMTDQAWKSMWQSYMAALNAKYAFNGANVFASRKKDKDGNAQGSLPILIRTFTPHELRHTFCTLLYRAGIDALTAKDQMGHADIGVTMSIYTHLDTTYKVHKMHALDDYLNTSVEPGYKSNTSQEIS